MLIVTIIVKTCFSRANDFLPKRWSSQLSLIKDKTAYAPFSQGELSIVPNCDAGIYNCVGKQLALSKFRLVTALLVSEFSICFKAGDDGSAVVRDTHDHFTALPGRLELIFEPLRPELVGKLTG